MNELTGKPALDFQFTDIEGVKRQLGDYRNRWLLLVFHRHLS